MTPTLSSPSGIRSLESQLPDEPMGLLHLMLQIRLFEDETRQLFADGLMRGSTHLYQGQEAIAVGVCSSLRAGDTMTCTYRGHGAVIAMGSALDRCFGELLGKEGGLCRGKGGSMHFTDVAVGALGANAIVGANLPITVGAALAAQYQNTGAVSVAFFGDGATNIGAFHESLNLAAIWKLPAIFVIENNQYGEYSPLASTTPITRLADRAASYGIPGVYVDGNDVLAVQDVTLHATERARNGEGPTLIEADTYRQQGHSRSDLGQYRPAGELESWLARDPIGALEGAIVRDGAATQHDIDALHEQSATEVKDAAARAMTWHEPHPDTRLEDVYA
jgi:pyruvate dehydrogenase E1 component alpha subunit